MILLPNAMYSRLANFCNVLDESHCLLVSKWNAFGSFTRETETLPFSPSEAKGKDRKSVYQLTALHVDAVTDIPRSFLINSLNRSMVLSARPVDGRPLCLSSLTDSLPSKKPSTLSVIFFVYCIDLVQNRIFYF